MAVRVLLFAQSAEWVGTREVVLEPGSSLPLGRLLERPEFAGLKGRGKLRYALNREFRGPRALVRDGDEVAVLPPVSGG